MTSILYHSGLNYSATNPLRGELNVIRDSVSSLEKNFKDMIVSGGGGAVAGAGARGVTAGLKEVALTIVTLRTEIEGLKARITVGEADKKRIDGILQDLVSRMSLTETAVGTAVSTVSSLNATVLSLMNGGVVDTNTGIESALISVAPEESTNVSEVVVAAESEVGVATAAATADEDESASEEILAMLRN